MCFKYIEKYKKYIKKKYIGSILKFIYIRL